jgi:hypothetical protein
MWDSELQGANIGDDMMMLGPKKPWLSQPKYIGKNSHFIF